MPNGVSNSLNSQPRSLHAQVGRRSAAPLAPGQPVATHVAFELPSTRSAVAPPPAAPRTTRRLLNPSQALAQIHSIAASEAPRPMAGTPSPPQVAARSMQIANHHSMQALSGLVGTSPSPLVLKSLEAIASDMQLHGGVTPAGMARVRIAVGVDRGKLAPAQARVLGRAVDLMRRGDEQVSKRMQDPSALNDRATWQSLQRNMKVMSELAQRVTSLIVTPSSLNVTAIAHLEHVISHPKAGMAINGLNNALRTSGLGEVAEPYVFRQLDVQPGPPAPRDLAPAPTPAPPAGGANNA